MFCLLVVNVVQLQCLVTHSIIQEGISANVLVLSTKQLLQNNKQCNGYGSYCWKTIFGTSLSFFVGYYEIALTGYGWGKPLPH